MPGVSSRRARRRYRNLSAVSVREVDWPGVGGGGGNNAPLLPVEATSARPNSLWPSARTMCYLTGQRPCRPPDVPRKSTGWRGLGGIARVCPARGLGFHGYRFLIIYHLMNYKHCSRAASNSPQGLSEKSLEVPCAFTRCKKMGAAFLEVVPEETSSHVE